MSELAALDAFQRDFSAALRGDDGASAAAAALAAQPGFAIYRATVRRGAVDALVANHPTVRQLVGEAWIEAAAAAFVAASPPRDGSLAAYGDGFGAFLDGFEPAAELPYLGDVARLDRAWTESQLAADAPVLAAATLAALDAERLLDAVLVPHPAARWLRFATQPAFTIWRRHREGAALDAALAWRGEGALLSRPALTVEWREGKPAALAFLDACAEGLPFAAAADRAAAATHGLAASAEAASAEDSRAGDPSLWLPGLVAAGAFTRVELARSGTLRPSP